MRTYGYEHTKAMVSTFADEGTAANAGNGNILFSDEDSLLASPLTQAQLTDLHNLASDGDAQTFGSRAEAGVAAWAAVEATYGEAEAATGPGAGEKPKKVVRGAKKDGESKPGRKAGSGGFAGMKLKSAVKENPRREGSHGHGSFQVVLDNPGITYEDFIAKGGRVQNLRKDVELKRIVAVAK